MHKAASQEINKNTPRQAKNSPQPRRTHLWKKLMSVNKTELGFKQDVALYISENLIPLIII